MQRLDARVECACNRSSMYSKRICLVESPRAVDDRDAIARKYQEIAKAEG
jgi:hypothetical protein